MMTYLVTSRLFLGTIFLALLLILKLFHSPKMSTECLGGGVHAITQSRTPMGLLEVQESKYK